MSDSGAARAQVELPSPAKRGSRRMLLHPVMVDVAVQVLGATKAATDIASEGGDARTVVLPVRFAGVRAFGDVTTGTCAVGSLSATDDPNRLRGKVVLNDAQGDTVLEIDEVEMAVLRTGRHVDELTSKLFELEWQPTILNKVAPDVGGAVLMVDESGEGDSLVGRLKAGLAVRTQSVQSVSARDDRALSSWCFRPARSMSRGPNTGNWSWPSHAPGFSSTSSRRSLAGEPGTARACGLSPAAPTSSNTTTM